MVYKVESLDDPGQPHRRYELVDPALRHVTADLAWVATETIARGADPTCQMAAEVLYAYRAQPETLEVHVGSLGVIKQHDGTCVPTRRFEDVELASRAEGDGAEEVIRAPVGLPGKLSKAAVPVDNGAQFQDKSANQVKRPPQKKPLTKAPPPLLGSKDNALGNLPDDKQAPPQQQAPAQNAPRGDAQVAPQPQQIQAPSNQKK
jgi:hypothetical protein